MRRSAPPGTVASGRFLRTFGARRVRPPPPSAAGNGKATHRTAGEKAECRRFGHRGERHCVSIAGVAARRRGQQAEAGQLTWKREDATVEKGSARDNRAVAADGSVRKARLDRGGLIECVEAIRGAACAPARSSHTAAGLRRAGGHADGVLHEAFLPVMGVAAASLRSGRNQGWPRIAAEIRSRPRIPSIQSRPAGGGTGTCTILRRCRAP